MLTCIKAGGRGEGRQKDCEEERMRGRHHREVCVLLPNKERLYITVGVSGMLHMEAVIVLMSCDQRELKECV